MKISVAIITLNEEKNIRAALESVSWADEVVVVDSGSSDKTIEIAKELGARVIEQEWLGFGKQKQIAVEHCSNEWVLSIDADETVGPELRSEIESLKSTPAGNLADGYLIPRRTVYMGRPILHSGWYPDRQIRLFRKNSGKWKDKLVHESFELKEGPKTGHLAGEIGHISVRNVREHIDMISTRYAPLGAAQMEKDGRTTSPPGIAIAGPLTFFRTYLLKLGILDGFPGFCIAMFAAYNVFLKKLLLYEKQNNRRLHGKD